MNIAFLTDRWGDPVQPLSADNPYGSYLVARQPPETMARAPAAIERLVPMMWDECSFVAVIDGVIGILVEAEFDDGFEPSDEHKTYWEGLAPPGAWFKAIKGDGDAVPTFNDRWVLWGFFPEEIASAARTKHFGMIALGIEGAL